LAKIHITYSILHIDKLKEHMVHIQQINDKHINT